MTTGEERTESAVTIAALVAGAMIAEQVGGKATRDALFLSNFDVTSLPTMVIASSLLSVALVLAASRTLAELSPARFVPAAFAASGLLHLLEWGLSFRLPRVAAVTVYLHIALLGALLVSTFWSLVNERFDPRTARRRFGRIATGGALGGLLGGFLADRMGAHLTAATMLPALAVFHLFCAARVRALGAPPPERKPRLAARLARAAREEAAPSGLQVLRRAPYLRSLALLLLLGAASAGIVDYVFKVQATATHRGGADLIRFFAAFYTTVGLATFLVQTAASRFLLERFGLAGTVATLPITVAVGSAGALAAPGLASASLVRGGEGALRSSLFRSGYELLYTPLPPEEKRAAKPVIDVGFERLGDAAGGMILRSVIALGPSATHLALLPIAILLSIAGLFVTHRLGGGYVKALERSLLDRVVRLDEEGLRDRTTRSAVSRSLGRIDLREIREAPGGKPAGANAGATPGAASPPRRREGAGHSGSLLLSKARIRLDEVQAEGTVGTPRPASGPGMPEGQPAGAAAGGGTPRPIPVGTDPLLARIAELRSGDPARVRAALEASPPIDATLVPHVLPLLAWDEVAEPAMRALRTVASRATGQILDRLHDPDEEFAVRRRVPRVLATVATREAVEGLLRGLGDRRFEVRFQCGRALARLRDAGPNLAFDRDRVLAAVLREAALDQFVWEGQRLLDRLEDTDVSPVLDEYVKDRANRSMEHVFTLLSLVLPRQPLQTAFRGLYAEDEALRGTALEYLESVLPPAVRDRLWPHLEDRRTRKGPPRSRDEILADLVRSNESIQLHLASLRDRMPEG